MREIGIEHFAINTLLDGVATDALDVMEAFFINKYDSYNKGYNSTVGGAIGSIFTCENTIITKDHIDVANIAVAIVDAFFENSL